MKTINLIRVALIVLLLTAAYGAQSQTINTIVSKDRVLKDTVIKSVTYKLYIGSRGGKYVIRTSKTGNQYKQYFKQK